MSYLLDDMMKTADTKILYENKKGKKMFHELIGDSDTKENIKMYLDGAKRSGLNAKVIPWDTPYDKPTQEKVATEEMSEKERHDREIAKLKRRRLLSGLAFAGGVGTDLGINIANETGRGNPKIKRNIKRVNYPATLLATYGLVDSNLKLKRKRAEAGGGPTTLQEEKDMFKGSDRESAKWRSRGRKLALTGAALRFAPKYLVNSANAIQDENKKNLAFKALRGSSKAGGYMLGAGLVTSGMNTALSERAHKRYISRLEQEQEKTAAPMFGKKRYIPRNANSQMSRLYYENDLNRYKKFSNAPDFDESAFEKSQQAIDEYRPINLEENGKTLQNVFSSLIAADMARRGGMHLLSGNKPAAKRFGVAAGLASIYPAYRGVEGLKRRYHFSKEKNIEADKAEVAKDDAARSAYRDYLDKHNGGEGGWHATWSTLSDASKHALLNEAKKKNARIQYNEDYSTNFVNPKGKKSKRRWENTEYLNEDDFDDSDISLRRLSKKTALLNNLADYTFEKTAVSRDAKISGLVTAGGLGLTAATLYGSLAMQKRLKEKYGDIDGVNETSILSGIGNDRASNRIYATKEQRERAEKFRKSFNRLNFGSRVGFGVGGGLGVAGASMLANAVSRR